MMKCDNEFRHVCIKDLEDYIKRDNYFSDYTDEEVKLIQKNLGLPTIRNLVVTGTYDTILNLKNQSKLELGCVYIINNFRSIYLDKDGTVCGLDSYVPSQEYMLILHPTSISTFDCRVGIYSPNNSECSTWIVEYDITPTTFKDGTNDRGTITYLKDANNNYAYYDFKNIRFKTTIENQDSYCYTFGGISDNSRTKVSNVHIEKGATNNIFFERATNVTLSPNCHDNLFKKAVKNSNFQEAYYNTFEDEVTDCFGVIHNKTIGTLVEGEKKFMTLGWTQVIRYIDADSQTYQFKEI